MRKKILYVITKTTWGGAQQYVYDLAANLAQERFEEAVAGGGTGLPADAGMVRQAGLLFEKLREAGIRTVSIQGLERDVGFIREFHAFWNLVRLFRNERLDVIHLNSSKAAALGAAATFLYRIISKFQIPSPVIQLQLPPKAAKTKLSKLIYGASSKLL